MHVPVSPSATINERGDIFWINFTKKFFLILFEPKKEEKKGEITVQNSPLKLKSK
jgi:hypothetical protein